MTPPPVRFVGAGPGDPDLLTLKALKALQSADVVLHDRLIGAGILALIPDGTEVIETGKTGFGPTIPQAEITALLLAHAAAGRRVVRLKSGDAGIFGRLDEEVAALDTAGIGHEVIPGITAAAAAAARIGQSLTRRGRNGGLRILTAHDVEGFAEQDWRGLAAPGAVAAIYMGRRAARFLQGRLMMHGAAPDTPVTLVENASRPEERIVGATLSDLAKQAAVIAGPVVILWGLAPRAAARTLPLTTEAFA